MKRIRSVKKYLADIDENGTFYIGVQVDSKVKNILTQYFDVMDSKKLYLCHNHI